MNAAIKKVKDALNGGNNEEIKKATEELQQPLYEISAAAYQQAQAAGAQAGPEAGPQEAQGAKADDDVVDAEYTEVKDNK